MNNNNERPANAPDNTTYEKQKELSLGRHAWPGVKMENTETQTKRLKTKTKHES